MNTGTEYKTDNGKHSEKGTKIIKPSKSKMKFQPSWLLKTDSNRDQVKDYLRLVNKKPYQAYCAVDNTLLNIGTRGWSQIYDHGKKNKHTQNVKQRKSQHLVGVYSQRHLADKAASNNFNMRLLLICNEHGVALDNYDYFMKCVKECCPDISIAQSAKALSRKSVTAKLRFGLAKTELDETLIEIRNVDFSAVIDAGTKGNKKLFRRVRHIAL